MFLLNLTRLTQNASTSKTSCPRKIEVEKATKEMQRKMEEDMANVKREYGEWKTRLAVAHMYGGTAKFWRETVEKMDEVLRLTEEENEELRPNIESLLEKTSEEYDEIVAEIEELKKFVKQREGLLEEIENSW